MVGFTKKLIGKKHNFLFLFLPLSASLYSRIGPFHDCEIYLFIYAWFIAQSYVLATPKNSSLCGDTFLQGSINRLNVLLNINK